MRCAYLSLDEVNQDLAGRLAAAVGMEIDALSLRDPAPNDGPDAVLYDLDYLPPDTLRALLADLTGRVPACPVAVHSYRLSGRQVRELRRRGVIVVRRLGAGVFARLRAAMAGRRVNTGPARVV
jgi:hypothetical protein